MHNNSHFIDKTSETHIGGCYGKQPYVLRFLQPGHKTA